jgi:hypothetical protein
MASWDSKYAPTGVKWYQHIAMRLQNNSQHKWLNTSIFIEIPHPMKQPGHG